MQRIQSLFLLFVIALCIPAAVLTQSDVLSPASEIVRLSAFRSYNFHTATGDTGLLHILELALLFGTMLVSVYTISQFKQRRLQMKLCVLSILMQFGVLALIALMLKPYLEIHALISYYAPIIFPLFSIVFLWLAYKGVKSDDHKIKSIDRIR